MKRRINIALVGITAFMFITGCSTSFKEDHYFQAIDSDSGEVSNYYRLRVNGYARFSSARYVSGYYDERAVDMFFNEVKLGSTASSATGSQALFSEGQTNPEKQDKITPLTPTGQTGAFVMVLSNNASSVTNTIGSFAESQIVAEAVTNLANKDLLRTDKVRQNEEIDRANAVAQEIERLMNLVPDTSPGAPETERAYLRVLNAIAVAIDGNSKGFSSLDEAQQWLESALR